MVAASVGTQAPERDGGEARQHRDAADEAQGHDHTALAEAERAAVALRGERRGPVRIGGFSTVLRRLVGPAIADLAIVLLERRTDAPPPRGVAVEELLLRDAYRVVVPASWPERDDPEALLAGRWIAGPAGSPARAALDSLAPGPLDIGHVCREYTSMLALVGAGLGATVVTDLVLDFVSVSNIRVSSGPLDPGARILYAAYRRGRAEPGPAVAAVLEALHAQA